MPRKPRKRATRPPPEAVEETPPPVVESTEVDEPNVDVALANAHLDSIPAILRRAMPQGAEGEALAARLAQHAKQASSERELVVRKDSPASAPKAERKPSKIGAVLEKAKTVGITMAQVKEMTGWSKTGGFFGAAKRAGLTLTKDASGAYHAA